VAAVKEGRLPPNLALCRACNQYIYPQETTCTHCGGDVAQAALAHAETVARRRALVERLEQALFKSQSSFLPAPASGAAEMPGTGLTANAIATESSG
jgi:hypothetical protein